MTSDLWTVDYELDRPYHDVSHDVALLKGEVFGAWGTFKGTYPISTTFVKNTSERGSR